MPVVERGDTCVCLCVECILQFREFPILTINLK